MSDIKIRTARPEDGGDLDILYSFEEVVAFTTQLPHRPAGFWRDFYRSRDPDSVELVAEIGGRAVGHLGMFMNRQPRRKHVASFGIAVHPDFHGRGAGRALMAEMINMADNWLNIVRLELSVASHNRRAMALYESCGFEREGETRFDLFTGGTYSHTTHMARLHPRMRENFPAT